MLSTQYVFVANCYLEFSHLNLVAAVVLVLMGGQVMHANAATLNQTGVLVEYGGLVDVSLDGYEKDYPTYHAV